MVIKSEINQLLWKKTSCEYFFRIPCNIRVRYIKMEGRGEGVGGVCCVVFKEVWDSCFVGHCFEWLFCIIHRIIASIVLL